MLLFARTEHFPLPFKLGNGKELLVEFTIAVKIKWVFIYSNENPKVNSKNQCFLIKMQIEWKHILQCVVAIG